jgi:hypothetical protein
VTIEVPALAALADGYGLSGEEAEKVVEYRKESGDSSSEVWHGPKDGAEISGNEPVAE